jgi:hypothetical protein
MGCIEIIYKIFLLDFVHHLNYKIMKQQCFRSWILLPFSGKKGERRQKAYLLVLLVEVASGQKPSDFNCLEIICLQSFVAFDHFTE